MTNDHYKHPVALLIRCADCHYCLGVIGPERDAMQCFNPECPAHGLTLPLPSTAPRIVFRELLP